MIPDTLTCPHCGRAFGRSNLTMHRDRCPREPARYAAIRAMLDDGAGYILSIPCYRRLRTPGKAHPRTLMEYCGGDWGSVAAAFGLDYAESQRSAAMKATHARKKAQEAASSFTEKERAAEEIARQSARAALEEERTAPRGLPELRRRTEERIGRATDPQGREFVLRIEREIISLR